jgi:signal transduction histidine kinase
MLAIILDNLVANAIKYTGRGGVVVGCRRRTTAIVLSVSDTGIGIPEDAVSSIFEEFRRIDMPNPQPGLGLGLSIVKRTADLLGCRLTVRSVVGRGSSFFVEIPLGAAGRPER